MGWPHVDAHGSARMRRGTLVVGWDGCQNLVQAIHDHRQAESLDEIPLQLELARHQGLARLEFSARDLSEGVVVAFDDELSVRQLPFGDDQLLKGTLFERV